MEIRYRGPADIRELGSEDLKKMGVRSDALTFKRGVAQEVSSQVAQALMESPLVIDEFEVVESAADGLVTETDE